MKKFFMLCSVFALLTAFTCENEPIDDGIFTEIENPNGTVNANLVGEWQLVALDYSGTSTTTVGTVSTTANFVGTSANEDYTLDLNADGSYTTSGSYDIELETEITGIPNQTNTVTLSSSGSGTYTSTATTITTSGALVDIALDGVTQPNDDVEGTTNYTLSNDGNTLTFNSDDTQIITQDGVTAEVSINATSIFTRVGGGDTGGETVMEGTWLLTAWNAVNEPVDINNDGTASTNLLDEMDCYTNETLVFNANGTGTNNSTSYADFAFDIVVGTTNEFNYTVDCIEEIETTNITWSQNGNTVTIGDEFGDFDWTLNGNQLSILVPEGFIAFNSEDVEVSTSQDLMFVYTKQ